MRHLEVGQDAAPAGLTCTQALGTLRDPARQY